VEYSVCLSGERLLVAARDAGLVPDTVLVLEHPRVVTLGRCARPNNVLWTPEQLRARGFELVKTDRGGDVTYHGPGQLVGYPIVSVPMGREAIPSYVHAVEQLVIDALADVGLPGASRLDGYPGVWIDGRKICAIGVRVSRGEGPGGTPVRLLGRLAEAGVASSGLPLEARKPEWLRVKANMGPEYRALKRTMRSLNLVTVCEEAGCPNIFECWADGTATFMVNGDQCTRACRFCLVDTSRPSGLPDPAEPARVAEAVAHMGLAHAVVTAVARDDLPDGGAEGFAEVIRAVRRRTPGTTVEVLVPDCKGEPAALDVIFAARPDVLNHNLETVARLQ